MKTSAIFYRNLYESYNDLYRFSVALAVLFIVRTAKVSILSLFCRFYLCNHSIFRHDDFIGCFSADKIKKSVRKYFCFNITIYKNMAEELSCRKPFPKEYIQTSASGNPEDLYH